MFSFVTNARLLALGRHESLNGCIIIFITHPLRVRFEVSLYNYSLGTSTWRV